MPDFADLEKEADSHSQRVDEGLSDVDKEAERDIGDQQGDGKPAGL
jgi:hypothetical protein